ncbi:hypothetical protein Y886_39325 [Xanthomonas hyacinthi DSM 19077]|nr:hypothetical protein Y886_39325 [Xanthomonas hyacinthi DSM 19077]
MGARGGFRVDLAWSQGKVASVTIHSAGGSRTRLRWGLWAREIALQPGKSVTFTPGPGET